MSGRKFIQLLALLVNLFNLEPRVVESNTVRCIEEREALLLFKQGLVNEANYLSSWGRENDKKKIAVNGEECGVATKRAM